MQSVFKESYRAPPQMGGRIQENPESDVWFKSYGPRKLCSKQYINFKTSSGPSLDYLGFVPPPPFVFFSETFYTLNEIVPVFGCT